MSTFKSFEETEVWQKARILARKIYTVTKTESFSRDFKLKDQINGSAGSIMDNIAEGFERDGGRELIQFLAIAKGSSGEVRSQLYRALDHNHISEQTFEELRTESEMISKQLSGFMNYINRSGIKGTKFKQK